MTVPSGHHQADRLLVLLAGDDEAELLGRLLSGLGYEVDVTTDPAAALGHLPTAGVVAVVLGLDVGPAPDHGVAVLRQLRELGPPAGDAPVVGVAARADGLADAAREAGITTVLTKPIHVDDLAAALRQLDVAAG